ncbi:hypothetical protein BH10BAC5_BH10BAC5_25900 [soil metagenome]
MKKRVILEFNSALADASDIFLNLDLSLILYSNTHNPNFRLNLNQINYYFIKRCYCYVWPIRKPLIKK